MPSRSFTSLPPTATTSVEGPLFVLAPTRSERDSDIPIDTFTHISKTYQLVFWSKNFWRAEFYCRHQRNNSAWFECFSCLNSFTETSFGKFNETISLQKALAISLFTRSWKLLIAQLCLEPFRTVSEATAINMRKTQLPLDSKESIGCFDLLQNFVQEKSQMGMSESRLQYWSVQTTF